MTNIEYTAWAEQLHLYIIVITYVIDESNVEHRLCEN